MLPLRRFGAPIELDEELSSQVALLEAMFDDPGLTALRRRHKDHPAVRRHDNLVAGRQTPPDEDLERQRLQDLSQGFWDRETWAQKPAARPFWSSTVPEENQARMVENRIEDPQQFEDTTLELFAWGALRIAGIAAELQESEGQPDIRLPGSPQVGWLEVKRIHVGTVPSRARRVLTKANRQIKSVSLDRAGTLYLFVGTTQEAAVFDDATPADVEQYIAEVQRTLGSSADKHVGQVVVGWDDFMVLGHFPDPVMYAFRRRALVLNHANAVSPPTDTDWASIFGFTSTTWVRPSSLSTARPAPLVTSKLVVGDLFQDRNSWVGGIRASHARRVLDSPDGLVEVQLATQGMTVVLATKRIDLTGSPHVMLLIGYRRGDERLTLADGFRLRGSEAELEAWKVDPSTAFDQLLRRYGLPVSIGSEPAQLFHVHHEAPGPLALSVRSADVSRLAIAAFIKSTSELWEADWVYAVDDAAYRRSYRP